MKPGLGLQQLLATDPAKIIGPGVKAIFALAASNLVSEMVAYLLELDPPIDKDLSHLDIYSYLQ